MCKVIDAIKAFPGMEMHYATQNSIVLTEAEVTIDMRVLRIAADLVQRKVLLVVELR